MQVAGGHCEAADVAVAGWSNSVQTNENLLALFIERVEDYAIFFLDPDGEVITWNRGAERIKGYHADEIIGRHISVFYPPDGPDSADHTLQVAAEEGHHEFSGWRLRKDGTQFWAEISVTALTDESGNLTGFAKITRDLTERKAAEELIRQAEISFQLLMTGVKEYAIFMMDPEGRITEWNAAAERLLGYSHDEVKGQRFSIFFTPEEGEPGGVADRELKLAASVGRASDDRWHVRKDGTHFWASGITSALRDEDGTLRGYAKVLRDNTERKRYEEELRAKADALEEADRRKDQFLAMLAHELRNPLAPIATAVTLLGCGQPGAETHGEAIAILDRQVEKLTRLIDDLMDVSRISRGKVQLKLEEIDLRSVIQSAVDSAKALIDERRHTLAVSLPDAPLWMNGDATRLEQVFENLLTNAAKYTESGGEIALTAEQVDGVVTVRLKDTGVGIPPEILPHVFDLFYQADPTLDRAQGGLGIGLTIVRSIVELHDGAVEAKTEGVGKGSEFLVKLPLGRSLLSVRPPLAAPSATATGILRVLVVDDNVDAAKSLGMLLQSQGHDVRLAYCGFDALEAMEEYRPHVVLLDIGLPGLDGYQVAQRVREQPQLGEIILVAVTGYGQPEDRRRSKEAGFDYHLVKPIKIQEAQEILNRVVVQ